MQPEAAAYRDTSQRGPASWPEAYCVLLSDLPYKIIEVQSGVTSQDFRLIFQLPVWLSPQHLGIRRARLALWLRVALTMQAEKSDCPPMPFSPLPQSYFSGNSRRFIKTTRFVKSELIEATAKWSYQKAFSKFLKYKVDKSKVQALITFEL